jgi:hypothetical protein
MSITTGQGPLGKIYERLRKRNYRANQKLDAALVDLLIGVSAYEDELDDENFVAWEDWAAKVPIHDAYVVGVRDALKAVEGCTVTLGNRLVFFNPQIPVG